MATIVVRVGELAKPLRTYKITKGTTLQAFVERIGADVRNVRVNGEGRKLSAKLRAGDIVTFIGHVSGGK